MTMTKRVTEARPVVDDPEGFWSPIGGWIPQTEVVEINEAIIAGTVTVVTATGFNDGWMISLGGGRVYEVEVVNECPYCQADLVIDETTEDGICGSPGCRADQAADLNSGY